MGNMMKMLEKQGIAMPGLIQTHAGPVSTDDKVMPPGVPRNFLFLKSSLDEFAKLKAEKREFGEKTYKRLFDDLITNERDWLRFFGRLPNQSHAGDACLILEKLATIYLARKDWKECGAVLDYWQTLIDIIRKHNLQPNKTYDLSIMCDNSEHSLKSAMYDMNEMLGRNNDNAKILKDLIRLEKSPNLDGIPENIRRENVWNNMVGIHESLNGNKLSSRKIERLTDEDVAKVLISMQEAKNIVTNAFPGVAENLNEKISSMDSELSLLVCAFCGKKEEYLGQLKKCTRCKNVVSPP